MSNIKFKSSTVELLSRQEDVQTVWKTSRPHLDTGEVNLNDITSMALPINGFLRYTLKFTASLLFRDLIFLVRPIAPWAMSNRTFKYNYDNMFLSQDEVTLLDDIDRQVVLNDFTSVIDGVMDGGIQDYLKQYLPRITMTTFCVNIDIRTLFNFIYTLELHIPQYFDLFGKLILEAIGEDRDLYYTMKKRSDLFPYISISDSENLTEGIFKNMDNIAIIKEVTGNLMAQFIRQHSAHVKSSIPNELVSNFTRCISSNCNDLVRVAAYVDKPSLDNLVSTRTCWFAQMDKDSQASWSSIIGDIVRSQSTKDFMKGLPCHGCGDNCTILNDMLPRIHHDEVNPPCPLLLENPELIDYRFKKYESNSVIMEKWRDVGKTIRINPNNKYALTYFSEEEMHTWKE